MNQEQTVIVSSPEAMGFKIQELVQKGWTINPNHPVSQLNFQWECGFIRNATPEQIAEDNKPSRAEILAKARATKAAKKETNNV